MGRKAIFHPLKFRGGGLLIHNSTPKRMSLGLNLICSNQADIKTFLHNQFEEFPTARLFCRKSQRLHFCKIAKVYACSSLVALFLKIFDSFFQYFTLRCLLHSYQKGMFGQFFRLQSIWYYSLINGFQKQVRNNQSHASGAKFNPVTPFFLFIISKFNSWGMYM